MKGAKGVAVGTGETPQISGCSEVGNNMSLRLRSFLRWERCDGLTDRKTDLRHKAKRLFLKFMNGGAGWVALGHKMAALGLWCHFDRREGRMDTGKFAGSVAGS